MKKAKIRDTFDKITKVLFGRFETLYLLKEFFEDNPNEITRFDLIRLGIATAVSPITSHLAL